MAVEWGGVGFITIYHSLATRLVRVAMVGFDGDGEGIGSDVGGNRGGLE